MKQLSIVLILLIAGYYSTAQNITRANHSGPYGVQVNTFTGNVYLGRTDLVIPNQGLSIDLSFSYNSYQDTVDQGYGQGWTFSYGMGYERDTANIVIIRSVNGRRDRYQASSGVAYTRPVGFFDELEEYETDKFVKTDKYGVEHFFDDPSHGKLTRIEDPNGNTITLTYEGERPVEITDASGRKVRLIWREDHLSAVEDKNGASLRRIEYRYDIGGRLILVKDPLGSNRTYTYNSKGLLSGMTDENGNEMTILYDRNQAAVTLGSCRSSTKFEYDQERGVTYVQEANAGGNQLTTYLYDQEGKLIRKTGNCCGYNTGYAYDDDNNVREVTDANGQVYRSNFDQEGNPVQTTDPLGNQQRFTYTNSLNRLASTTDERGNTSQFNYDGNGNLTTINQPEGVQLQMGYDAAGNLTTVTDGNGQSSTLGYNDNNDLIQVQYPIGSEAFTYDGVGNLLSSTDANNHTVTYQYDLLDRLTSITDPLDNRAEFAYDAASNLTQEVDPNDNVKSYTYDEHHRLAAVTTPTGTTNYLYDARDNLTGIVDANQHVTSFQYDKLNRLVQESDPLGNTTQYEHDGNGNVITRVDANGQTATYTYDALNRLVRKQYEGNTDNYEYDAVGNLIRCSNKDISLRFTYDGLNRLINKLVENWGKSISYTYDNNGNRLTMTDPEGGITYYTYDANNRLVALTNPSNQLTEFTYDDAGRMTRQDNANGTYALYTYDAADRLLSIQHLKSNGFLFAGYVYTYDANGNRLSMTDSDNETSYYTYDGDNRLTNVEYGNGDIESYTFDGKGNRLTKTLNGVTTNYTYDAADRIQTAGNISYQFDANGNMTLQEEGGQMTHYAYDGEDRLVEVTLPGSEVVGYQYDPFGNRISTIDGQGGVTRYFHDLDNVLMEMDRAGNVLVRYTSGLELDFWIGMERGGANYVYHADGLNSVIALTSTNQNLVQSYQYEAYGNVVFSVGNTVNNYRYTGREYDVATGNYYYRTRFYDSISGRFITADAFPGILELPESLNYYNYVFSNPIIHIDPEGEWVFLVHLARVAIPYAWRLGKFAAPYIWRGTVVVARGAVKVAKLLRKAYGKLPKSIRNFIGGRLWQGGAFQAALSIGRQWYKNGFNCIDYFDAGVDFIDGAISYKPSSGLIGNLKEFGKHVLRFYNLPTGTSKKALAKHGAKVAAKTSFDYYLFDCNGKSGFQNNLSEDLDSTLLLIVIQILRPIDPNEITGPAGYGPQKWVSINDQLPYTIYFENDPDYATAPAQRVVIRHPFDANINPFSLRLGDFGFGSYMFQVPEGRSQYRQRLDLRDSLGLFVDVIAGVDVENNEAFWILESIDPATGLLTTLPPDIGFLPVNDSLLANGEGFVNFRVQPRSTAQTGDEVQALAKIFFDDEAPIATNIHTNVIDALPPVSGIANLPAGQNSTEIDLQFTGQDDTGGVGLAAYDLYVSKDGGDFGRHAEGITGNSYLFQADEGGDYAFYVQSVDQVGNREEKSAPEQSIAIGLPKRLTLYQPEAGSTTCAAGSMVIEWRASAAVNTIDIFWSLNGGGTYELLAASVDAAQEFYYHPIPFSFGTRPNVRVRVVDSEAGNLVSESASFRITAPDQTNITVVTCNPAFEGIFNKYLTNQYGCDSTVTTTVVWDNVPPIATCVAAYSIALSPNGQVALSAAVLDQGSSDNCAGLSFSFDAGGNQPSRIFTCADLGQRNRTLWVTDAAGNQDQCTVRLVITDAPGYCTECDGTELVFNNDPIPSDLYAASSNITSAGWIAANGTVGFRAADRIVLKPGFRVDVGGSFRALIAGCMPAAGIVPPTVETARLLPEPQLRIFPNPLSSETTIRYQLPEAGRVSLTVTDAVGRVVAVPLPAAEQDTGVYDERFSAQGLAPGVYSVQLEFAGAGSGALIRQSKRMVIIR